MKKWIYILLFVITLALAGCNANNAEKKAENAKAADNKESEAVEPTEIPTKVPTEAPTEIPKEVPTETPTEIPTEAPVQQPTEPPAEKTNQQEVEVPMEVPVETPIEAPVEVPVENSVETPVPETPTQTQVQEPEFVAYNPDNVAKLANDKVKAAGKILLPENLDSLLAEGKITQEEYNEYYPYDGCGYYSVFIETNLMIAQTISGQSLRSEDEIATHIAGMLVLETGPYVYVECNGVYNHNGTDFYEFRCYR